MSGLCSTCGTTNYDEAFEQAKQLAKQKAIQDGEAQALWQEGSEWHYGAAADAIAGGKPIAGFVSQYE